MICMRYISGKINWQRRDLKEEHILNIESNEKQLLIYNSFLNIKYNFNKRD